MHDLTGKIRNGLGGFPVLFVILPLLLGFLVAGLSQLGFFRVPNALVFDLAVAQARSTEPRVVVVRADPENLSRLTTRLRELGAELILVTADLAEKSVPPPGALIGLAPARVPGTETWVLPPLPRATADIVPYNQRQVGRRFLFSIPGESGSITTLEGAVAGREHESSDGFIGLAAAAIMPVLEARQILEGAFRPNTLDGKYIVIGPPASEDPPSILTSEIPGSPAVGNAGFHARAIQAILSDQVVFQLEGALRSLILIAAAGLIALLLFYISPQQRIAVAFLAAVLSISVGLALVSVADILLPVAELILLALGLGLAAAAFAARERRQRSDQLREQIASRLRRDQDVQDPSRRAEFFSTAAKLTGVQRSLLLRERRDGTFVPLAAFGLTESENSMSLARSPDFTRADETRPEPADVMGLVGWHDAQISRVDGTEGEGVYWLYVVPSSSRDYHAIAAAAARLARSRARQSDGLEEPQFGPRRREKAEVRLGRAVAALLTRDEELRRYLASLHTASILFDAAGMPVIMNANMRSLMTRCGLQPSRTTPVDLAVAITGTETDRVRTAIGKLVRYGGHLRLPSEAEIDGRSYLVRAAEIAGDLLVEIIDTTEQERLSRIQTELASGIDAQLRNDLEAIGLAANLAGNEKLAPEKRRRAFGLISQAVERTRETLDALARLVDPSALNAKGEPFPVNPRSTLEQELMKIAPLTERAGVTLDVRQPALTSLVMADPRLLEELIAAMLQVVISDSGRGSRIAVSLTEAAQETRLEIAGGFGLPARRLADSLASNAVDVAFPLRVIRSILPHVSHWGGAFQAESETGEGYKFNLQLRRA
ncbi:hypothetical protein G7A66_13005 [Altererythrobacter sp. SALINAS58]|uniref:hypothetical protein n=1 Tax=Alteripontixanthobacter muriae TaxID=2705546 RepID=UPI001577688D|nr:hypothetical protein [Alteripontixanthobacter muriae]NTZ43982.1 hypothetical protein [Alteripontixanthobacter muriae]